MAPMSYPVKSASGHTNSLVDAEIDDEMMSLEDGMDETEGLDNDETHISM